ncbi:MAG: MerR family transcriptional regulator [Pseudomonadota bacterium]
MSKADNAFRTISEVAELLAVQKHVLRFWELRFPQIKPMKRGGGRRYYRPEDLQLLRGIHHLLHADGYTIKGVQKILREQGVDAVKMAAPGGGEPSDRTAATPSEPIGNGRPIKRKTVSSRGGTGAAKAKTRVADRAVLRKALDELIACRQMLDAARVGRAGAGQAGAVSEGGEGGAQASSVGRGASGSANAGAGVGPRRKVAGRRG